MHFKSGSIYVEYQAESTHISLRTRAVVTLLHTYCVAFSHGIFNTLGQQYWTRLQNMGSPSSPLLTVDEDLKQRIPVGRH